MKPLRLLLLIPLALALPQDPPEEEPAGPEVGDPAPAFALNDHTGTKTPVGGEADHWTVVACFPKAMTAG